MTKFENFLKIYMLTFVSAVYLHEEISRRKGRKQKRKKILNKTNDEGE